MTTVSEKRKKILAISGSIRQDSTNGKILKAIASMPDTEMDLDICEEINELPFFDPGIPAAETPPSVAAFIERIAQADGVLICTPEYVFSLPGILKNALEWTVSTTVFSFKPVAFIVASTSGEKAFESLDLILRTLAQQPIPANQKIIVSGARGRIDESGKFTDPVTQDSVFSLVRALTNASPSKSRL